MTNAAHSEQSFLAQQPIVPVLAGGGTRLPAHVGVIAALDELQVRFDHIVGVSGGSIVAALKACGKSIEEIYDLALNVDFRQFRGFSPYQLLFYGGLSSGARFESWLDEQINGRRFGDLPINLHVVATDVQTGQPVIFDQENTPEVKISSAVRYSMGIPLLFAFKLFRGQVLVDGSILAEESLRRDWSRKGAPVCLFRIRTELQEQSPKREKPPLLPTFVAMLIRSFMTTVSREFINDAYWHSTIIINAGEVSPIEFGLSREKKIGLYQQGYQTALQYVPAKFMKYGTKQNLVYERRD